MRALGRCCVCAFCRIHGFRRMRRVVRVRDAPVFVLATFCCGAVKGWDLIGPARVFFRCVWFAAGVGRCGAEGQWRRW